jgi:NAD(P)H-dependent FMN reductase
MSRPKIAIIISTTRPTRFGDKPAQWIHDIAAARGDMDVEIIDLRDYPLPFFEEVASNLWVPSKGEEAQRWQNKIGQFDGYIVVAAEYNRGYTGVLKNALDTAYVEWNRKPMAFVGYGSLGAARAIEQLRLVAVELKMAPTRTGVHIQGADFMAALRGEKTIGELAYLEPIARDMLDELAWWTDALKTAREKEGAAKAA